MNYENLFTKPEAPFLVLFHIEVDAFIEDQYGWVWLDTEEEVRDYINSAEESFRLDDVFEIGAIREVKL